MRAVTVKNPWAWAIIHAGKRIENREWETKYRGPLLIHAGASKSECAYPGQQDLLPDEITVVPDVTTLAFSAIIGVVDLVDCVPYDRVAGDPFATGPWCWVLANPRACEPIPCKGALKLWVPSAEVVEKVEAALAGFATA